MSMRRLIVGAAVALALPFCANATTYYFKGAANSEMVFNASGAWTNAQGTAITVTDGATTYRNDDFVVGPKQIVTTYSKRFNNARAFYCKSLLLEGSESGRAKFIFRGSAFGNANFVLGPYGEMYLDGRDPATSPCGVQYATIFVREDAVGAATARISASTVMTHAEGTRIIGPISGTGSLLFTYGGTSLVSPITLMSSIAGVATNENFTGTMKIQGVSVDKPLPLQLKTNTLSALGGDPATFQQKGLELEYAKIVAYSNCTVTANRGVYVSRDSTIEVGTEYTFTVSGATAFATPSTKLAKTGAGALALGGEVAAGTFDVAAGTLNIAEGTTLAFHFTNRSSIPVLKISGAGTVNIPSSVKVKVTADEGVYPVSVSSILTSGIDFSGTTVELDEGSGAFVKSCRVNGNGEIEITTQGPNTYYFAHGGAADNTANARFYSSGAWTNEQGTAITVGDYSTAYQNDDFVISAGQTVTMETARHNNSRGFYCKSLLLKGDERAAARFIYRGSAFNGGNFILCPYGEIWLDGRNPATGGAGLQVDTSIHVDSSATHETPGMILASTVMTHAEGVALRGTLKGDGALLFRYYNASSDVKPITIIPTSTNHQFYGIMKVQGRDTSALLPLQVKNTTGLGGNPYSFEPKGLELEYANLKLFGIAENALMLPPNRGLYISRDSTIDVDAGITFTVSGALAFANASTALTKSGAGTLSLSKLQNNAVGGRINVAAGKLKLDAATISNGTSIDVLSLDSLSLDQGTVELHVAGDGSALGYGTELTIFRAGSMPPVVKSCVVIDAGAFTYPDDALLSYSIEGDALVMHIEKGYLFTGAVNGNFSETGNWSGGRKPSAGDGTNVVIKVGGAMSVTNDIPGLVLSTIMFKGSAAVTVLGDIAGVVSIVNESTAVQTFAGRVTFGDGSAPIEVCASSDSAYVDFVGGVVGSWPTAHAALHGDYMLTTQEYWTPENAMTLTSGSSLSVSNFNGTALVSIERGATMTVTNALVSSTSDIQWLLNDNHGTFQLLGTLTFDSTVAENGRTKFSKLENCTGTFVINGMDNIGKGSTYFASYRNVPVTHETCYAIGAGGIRATGTSYFLVGNGSWSTVFYPVADWSLTSAIYQWNTSSTTNMIQFGTTDWRDPSIGRTVTVSNRVASSKIACTAFGIGTLHFAHDAEFLGGFTASDSVVIALDAGCRPGNGAVTMNGTSTLKVAQSGTVTLGGKLTLGSTAALAFNFTDKATAPQLVIPAASTIPATVNVKISADEGIRPSSSRTYTLTSTFNFTGKTVNVIDKPKWVKSVDAVGGNIVLTAKPTGMVVIVK